MGADYIPERDARAGCWMKFFARGLVEHPDLYRITAADAQQVAAAVHAYRTALAVARSPDTRTKGKVRAKNDARKAAERVIRPMAQRIRTDTQIADALKVSIGLRPSRKRRRYVSPPESVPQLTLTATLAGEIEVRVSDSATWRRARPASAIGLELYERVRPREVVDAPLFKLASETAGPDDGQGASPWRFVGVFTRTPFTHHPAVHHPGDEVTLAARWVTRRGERGRFGGPKSIRALWNPALRIGALMRRGGRAAA